MTAARAPAAMALATLFEKVRVPRAISAMLLRTADGKSVGYPQPAIINRGGDAGGGAGIRQLVGGINRGTLLDIGNRAGRATGNADRMFTPGAAKSTVLVP